MHLVIERKTDRKTERQKERKWKKEAGKSALSQSTLEHRFTSGFYWGEGLGCTHSSPASLMCEYSTHTWVLVNKHTHTRSLSLSLSVNGHWTLSHSHGYTRVSYHQVSCYKVTNSSHCLIFIFMFLPGHIIHRMCYMCKFKNKMEGEKVSNKWM